MKSTSRSDLSSLHVDKSTTTQDPVNEMDMSKKYQELETILHIKDQQDESHKLELKFLMDKCQNLEQ